MKAEFSRLALALLLGSTVAVAAAERPGQQALVYGFRFASAIHNDPKDQGKAQEAVVLEMALAGDLAGARQRADQIVGWRRGTVYADLAAMTAEAGKTQEARELIGRAESIRDATQGWQSQRINAHVAQAWAKVGNAEQAAAITDNVASNDPRQYTGRAAATEASGLAVQGKFDQAMSRLSALDEATDFDVTWWRTLGYLDLARLERLEPAQRKQALAAARRSADGIDGWKRAEALRLIADAFFDRKNREAAIEALDAAEPLVVALPSTVPVKVTLLSDLASSLGRLGRRDHARELLVLAEKEAPQTLVIDVPGLLARVAGARTAIGDDADARRLFDAAFDAAESLVNARPRALAVVEICRTLGKNDVPLDDKVRGRLDALYSGLRAPW